MNRNIGNMHFPGFDLRNEGMKTELIPKKKEIDISEYKKFKTEDGASKVTYVSKDGAVAL